MKKSNLSYNTRLFPILAILCLLSSYLWIAPSQVHASLAGFQEYHALGNEGQTYVTGEATADNQMVYYDQRTLPQTFGLSLAEHLWPTEPLQTGNLSLSISKGDVPQAPGESDPSVPLQQDTTTLTVDILSSPWATVDHNEDTFSGYLPGVFVVEAVITNIGTTTATDVVVTLDYNEDSSSGWVLLAGEDPVRRPDELAVGEPYYAYWFARYPNYRYDDIPLADRSHQYTVTAYAGNASSVDTSDTVQVRSTQSTGNSGLAQTSTEIVVGVAFTVTQVYDIGVNARDAVFSPVGNDDFDPRAYRLVASEVRFYDDDVPPEGPMTVTDRLYLDTVPSWADRAEVTYTFLALLPTNTSICPYTAFDFQPGDNAKFDENYCDENTRIPITGALTVSVTKEASSSTIQQNQLLTYTIHYTNTGDLTLSYVWIWDDVDTDIGSILTETIDPPSDPDEATDSRVAWYLGTVPVSGQGSTGTLTFAMLVDGNGQDLADDTSLVNHAFLGISPSGLPPNAALTRTVTTTVQAPTVTLSKTDERTIAAPGDMLTYTLRVNNSGSIATSGLVITDELPAGVTRAGMTSPPFDSESPDGRTLVWNSQNVPADDTLVVTIPVVVNSDVPDETTLTNTATVTYRNTSGQHTFATETATDTTTVRMPVLTITKTAEDVDGGDLVVGDEILYTLQVANTGSYTAHNVTVTDDLPDQVTCQAVSGDSAPAGCADPLVWSIPSLAADATASLYITVTIDPGSEWQTITNTGSVTGENVPNPPDDPTPVCPDGSTPVGGVCPNTPEPLDTSLAFTKTAEDVDGGYLVVGDEILYTLQVTNIGGYTAYNVTVTDDLPDQVTCQAVSGDSAPAGCADPLVWSIPSLATDATASLYIAVTINEGSEGQTITNTGSVTGENVPNPPDDPTPVCPDGSTPVGGVCPTPVPTTTLAITKTAEDVDGGDLVVGDEILYTLQVANTGSHTAYNVTVTDDLPDQVTCQAVSGDSAPAGCADPLVWSIPSLAADATASLYITVTINPGSEWQTITNTGSVTGENVPNPPDDPTPVCPDGSTPVGGVCPNTPEPLDTSLAFTKTAEDVDGGDLVVGDEILYTLQVTNIGGYTAYNVTVTDDLPDQVTCQAVSGDSAPAGCADPLVWSIPSLATDATASLYIAVTINEGSEGQTITNTGSVTGENVPNPPDDPTPVCPDGSTPVGGLCPTPVEPSAGGIFLPIIVKNY